jgi:hypothetical protein|tara:strand:+ start:1705 stop:2022 length:318 start_codon:yes stop_codon:yes gene_type:complete
MLIYCEKKKTVLTENWINHVKEVIKNIENLLDIKIERSETNRLVKAHISLTNVTDENLIKCWLFLYDKTGIHESYSKGDIITQNNKFVIKYDKKIPSTNEIKKLL